MSKFKDSIRLSLMESVKVTRETVEEWFNIEEQKGEQMNLNFDWFEFKDNTIIIVKDKHVIYHNIFKYN